ncbi:MAG: hypothetical protein QXE34_01870 [Candidatus Aenigmatarchaeota archaeon]|nr:hypothetical protein [Candidatus Aenigmarchaeota archaeon]
MSNMLLELQNYFGLSFDRLDSFLQKPQCKPLGNPKTSQVYLIDVGHGKRYVLKISSSNPESVRVQYEISTYAHGLTPKILYFGIIGDRSVQIMEYVDGTKPNINDINIDELIKTIYLLQRTIRDFHYDGTIEDKIRSFDNHLRAIASDALAKVRRSKRQLVYYDLHRDNILATSCGFEIVDLDGIIVSPDVFMPASLFTSFFMLQDPKASLDDIRALISRWPEYLNERDILNLMTIRAIIGENFFRKKMVSGTASEEDLKLLELYSSLTQKFDYLRRVV